MILEQIKKENDIKNIPKEQLPALAGEIREFLIEKISCTGGHLASNLGVVELTMAMHRVFDLPKDKIIWDVGHQSYTHKVLTGRQDGFDELRKYGGMSGFPKRKESDCDCFDTGHSSTSISAGLGYVKARELQNENNWVVSVIGDGSLTGGMAFEALNNASKLKSNFMIVLNDNNMSISENTGAIATILNNVRTAGPYGELKEGVSTTLSKIPVYGDKMVDKIRKAKSGLKQLVIPGMMFEDMGITYLGPVDGHNIEKLQRVFKVAKKLNNSIIIHVITKKGKGYEPAEENPSRFHGTGPFDIETGVPKNKKENADYTDVFSKVLRKAAEKDNEIVAITAAMPDGTGLKNFARQFPKRFFDVGIAEGHAVTFAAGLAAAGMKPVVAIYSSFLQRAYDQIVHDVCNQNLHVVFAIDRAGLVGSDGETHQGIFDLSFLSSIPNIHILAPKNKWELADMLRYALSYDGPVAIRYPRGTACMDLEQFRAPIFTGKSEMIYEEKEIVLFSVGSMMKAAVMVRNILKKKGYSCSIVNARFVKPFDEEMLRYLSDNHSLIVTLEENVRSGGFGEHVLRFVNEELLSTHVEIVAIEDMYVEHGSVRLLKKELGLDEESIAARIEAVYAKVVKKRKQ